MTDSSRLALAANAVKVGVVRRLPPRVRRSTRDLYHRTRLRLGRGMLGDTSDFEQFLLRQLPRLGLSPNSSPLYLEFGLYQGRTVAAAVRSFDRCGLGQSARFVGLDSFEGLPPGSEDEGWGTGWFVTSRRTAEWNLRRQGMLQRVEIVEGWFLDSCTPELAGRVGTVDVVMIDCGIYSATDTALRFIEPMLADRCLVIFDDFLAFNAEESTDVGQVRAFAEFQHRLTDRSVERLGNVGHCGVAFLLSKVHVDWSSAEPIDEVPAVHV